MSKHGSNETLGFNHFGGYYGSLPEGYGGFDWSSVNYLNATYWERIQTEWCDSGYINACKGLGVGWTYENAFFESANLGETFTLKSMIAASAWETNQPFDLRTYVYRDGVFVLKASDTIVLNQTASRVNFATIGAKGDFANISAVAIFPGNGGAGNTCAYIGTYGTQMAFDNLKVHWNGTIPNGHNNLAGRHFAGLGMHHYVSAHMLAPTIRIDAASNDDHGNHAGEAPLHESGFGYHSVLTSLDAALGHNSSHGLTSQFVLPQLEHFGT